MEDLSFHRSHDYGVFGALGVRAENLGRGVLPASQKHYVQNCLTRGRECTVLKGAIYGAEGSCLNRAAMSRSLGYLPTQN